MFCYRNTMRSSRILDLPRMVLREIRLMSRPVLWEHMDMRPQSMWWQVSAACTSICRFCFPSLNSISCSWLLAFSWLVLGCTNGSRSWILSPSCISSDENMQTFKDFVLFLNHSMEICPFWRKDYYLSIQYKNFINYAPRRCKRTYKKKGAETTKAWARPKSLMIP